MSIDILVHRRDLEIDLRLHDWDFSWSIVVCKLLELVKVVLPSQYQR